MFSFTRREKLKSKKAITELFISGDSLKEFPLRLRYLRDLDSEEDQIKVAISVPKRSFKSAVDRNRIKRLIREAYRKNKTSVKGSWNLMFIYTDNKEWNYHSLEKKIIALLDKFSHLAEK